ncbi:MAG: helix-turn-helix domain-containing protein [Dorea sp.]|nr:helix-turn-helix domain-containing protein [Dorea sp.]
MRIPLSVLLFALSPNAEYESQNIDFLSQYEGVKLYDPNSVDEEGNPNYLYMISPDIFHVNKDTGRNRRHENLTLICVKGDCQAKLEDFHPQDSVIIINPPRSSAYMFNRIGDVFDNYSNWDHQIHLALLRNASMQELLNITKAYADHQVVILDKSFTLLASLESPDGQTDPYLQDIIENGFMTAETMAFFRKHGLFSLVKNPKNPMLFQTRLSDGTEYYSVQYTFTVNGNVVGYSLSIDRGVRPLQNAIDTVGVLGASLGLYFQRENYENRGTTEVYETILAEILNRDHPKLEHFLDKLSYTSDLVAEGKFWLLRIDYANQDELPYFFLSWYLRNSIAGMKPFCYNDHFYVLCIGRQNSLSFTKEEKSIFCKGFRGMPFAVSVSQIFFSLMDLKMAVWKCDEAFRFSDYEYETSAVFWYKDIYLRSLLEKLAENHMDQHYMSPEYELLKRYDQEHNTDFCMIYMKYLENGRNINQTANAIFLHRNTVLNKVKKANAILQNEREDYQSMIAFMLTYMKDHLL